MEHYCLECGHVMLPVLLDGMIRERCSHCGWIYYPQLKVGAGGLIENEGRLLLVQRANDPWKGCWYLPAGYMEVDEVPEKTAEREVFEETGLVVMARELLSVSHFADDPRGNGLLILFHCDVIGGSLQSSPETLQAGYFSPEEIPARLAGAAHSEAIRAWAEAKRNH